MVPFAVVNDTCVRCVQASACLALSRQGQDILECRSHQSRQGADRQETHTRGAAYRDVFVQSVPQPFPGPSDKRPWHPAKAVVLLRGLVWVLQLFLGSQDTQVPGPPPTAPLPSCDLEFL